MGSAFGAPMRRESALNSWMVAPEGVLEGALEAAPEDGLCALELLPPPLQAERESKPSERISKVFLLFIVIISLRIIVSCMKKT